MEQVKAIFLKAFSIHGDSASNEEIEERILSAGEVKGTNLCILVLAIVIASIGLNLNSTAVIIGAMLISPLMGGIMAIGYGIATADLRQARNSLVGLLIEVIVCLTISTIYFSISPLRTASSEIISRTSPTIWDVMIASFGGFAGIIGTTRKEKSNVIPGVAIATALMPPLCTAGYGIAHHSWAYCAGALYLFLINAYFICLTTIIGLLILKVPMKQTISKEKMKHIKKLILRNTFVFILPSLFFGVKLAYKEMMNSTEVYNSDVANWDIKGVTQELQIIYPQITDIEIGYLEKYDSSDEIKESLTVFIYSKVEISTEHQTKICKIIKLKYKTDDIRFIMNES